MAKNPEEEEFKTAAGAGASTAGEIQTVPLCPKALVHDVVQFDLDCLDFLHKLGEGGFGSVLACKFRRPELRTNSPAAMSCSTAASSLTGGASSDEGASSCASGEEQKIADIP